MRRGGFSWDRDWNKWWGERSCWVQAGRAYQPSPTIMLWETAASTEVLAWPAYLCPEPRLAAMSP